ncbi:hypothetical protein Hanom_Chr15g01345951 [Helianthus anomalus]
MSTIWGYEETSDHLFYACRLCGGHEETSDHLFSACYIVAVLWNKVSAGCKIRQIFAFSFKDLLSVYP